MPANSSYPEDSFRHLANEIRDEAEYDARIGRRVALGAFVVWEVGVSTLELTVMDMPNPALALAMGGVFLFGAGCAEFSRRQMNRLSGEIIEQPRDFDVLDTYEHPAVWEQTLNEPRNTDN